MAILKCYDVVDFIGRAIKVNPNKLIFWIVCIGA